VITVWHLLVSCWSCCLALHVLHLSSCDALTAGALAAVHVQYFAQGQGVAVWGPLNHVLPGGMLPEYQYIHVPSVLHCQSL
jgi:hypothetical protein